MCVNHGGIVRRWKARADKPIKYEGMKPRTKREREALMMSASLPEPSASFQRWAWRGLWHVGRYQMNGKVWCQCCGHVSSMERSHLAVVLDVDAIYQCPNCGEYLHLEQDSHWAKERRYIDMVGVVTTHKGHTVVRQYELTRWVYREKAQDIMNEVAQYWIDDDGREVILSRPYTRTPFSLSWHYKSPMTVRRHNQSTMGAYYYSDMFDCDGLRWYRQMRVSGRVRRNGFYMMQGNVNYYEGIKLLLTTPAFEEMVKHGQWEVARAMMRGERYEHVLPSVRICIRRGYGIPDFSMWRDMVDMMSDCGADVRCPKYVCPDDLQAAHDMWQRRSHRIRKKREMEARRATIEKEEAPYRRTHGWCIGVKFGKDGLNAHVLRSVAEFFDVGSDLHHCIFERRYYRKQESVCIAVCGDDGEYLEAAEVSVRKWKILQCRGDHNRDSSRHAEIVKLVTDNLKTLKQRRIDYKKQKQESDFCHC